MIAIRPGHPLIIAALKIELQAIQKRLDSVKSNADFKPQFLITGVGMARVSEQLHQFLERNPVDMILNLGTAGAINNALQPLDIIVPTEFYSDEEGQLQRLNWTASPDLEDLCKQQGWHLGGIYSSSLPIESASEKKRIASWGAVDIVDMEAFAIQQIGQNRHIPCYSIKIITDNAEENAEHEFQANLTEALDRLGLAAIYFLHFLCNQGH